MQKRAWDKKRVDEVCAVLARHETALAACRELGTDYRCLQAGLSKFGLKAGDFTKRAPRRETVNADPMVEHAAKQRAQREREQKQKLIEELAEAQARSRFLADIRKTPLPPIVKRRELGSGQREAMAVALLSDAHIEEVVRPEAVSGRNEYDLEISEQRMDRFFEALRWQVNFHRERWQVRDVLLWLGGDLLTGHIHDELIETNSLHPLEAILELRTRLVRGITMLLDDKKLERLTIPCNVGNHGRTTAKRRVKTLTENSYEWLLYNVLAAHFASDKRVRFEIPRSAHSYVEAYGMRLHFHHGDEVRYWGGVGGLSVPLGKRTPMWETVIESDIHHIGHFHQFRDFGRTVVNGSVIGYSEYALAIGAEYEPPQQAFYMLDSKRGKTCVSPLWVGESEFA